MAAEVNGTTPPLPKWIAIIRSPSGKGDRFDFNNIGSKHVHFFGDLAPYGFPDQDFWGGKDFYEADSTCRGFE